MAWLSSVNFRAYAGEPDPVKRSLVNRQLLVAAVALALSAAPSARAAQGKAKAAKPEAAAAAAAPAAAPVATTYEGLRAHASPAGDLGHLVEPLFGSCAAKDDLGKRQCELIERWHLDRLKERTWYATAEPVALQNTPYDSTVKAVTLTVNGCLQCGHPPIVSGAPRLIATGAPRGMDEGAPIGLDLITHDMTFETADKARIFLDKVRPRLRVEFVFGVGAPFETKTVKGVGIRLLGKRVYNQCTGEVVLSEPPSSEPIKITNRDPSCPAADAPTDEQIEFAKAQALLPDTISRMDVLKTLTPVQQRFYECGEEFELKQGVAKVHVSVFGDGKRKMTIAPPYDQGDVHLCFRSALNEVTFPRFKSASPPVEIDYPFVLRR